VLRWLVTKTAMVCLICGLCCGQQNVPDPPTYASFFVQVAQLKSGGPVFLNGQDTGLIQPSVQESMSLTDGEAEILHSVAVACVEKVRSFGVAARPLVLELRLRLMESDEPVQAQLKQRMNEIENHRDQITRSCIDDLRLRLGELRFEMVPIYIGSRKTGDFFPPISK
jgi:hypothetical protein